MADQAATALKAAQNATILVMAAVATLQGAGWTEQQIIPQLPYLASEAYKFLAAKARAS